MPNPFKPLRVGLLARSLLCLGGALTSQGCILPQTENVIPTLPNTAPRIIGHTPPDLIVTAYVPNAATPCTATTAFSVAVEDDDVLSSPDGGSGLLYRDTLTHRWFIDGVGQEGITVDGTPVDPGGSASRDVPAPSSFTARLGTRADSNRHLVEVYVTDGEFREDVKEPRPRTAQDRAYVATLAWFVQIEKCQ